MKQKSEVTGRLENWQVTESVFMSTKCIHGDLYEDIHERWEPGQAMFTSKLKNQKSRPKEGDVVETQNSRYLLGVPAEEIKDYTKEADK